jgi:DNA-binding response OmpR family regulator
MLQTQERDFTLLLVDDKPTNLLLLTNIIELDLPQVRILTASSAGEGLMLAEQKQIDGAFIDVQMPQVSGLDLCRKLHAKEKTARIPLVLMTAHMASPAMRAEGLKAGAYDFISQPISNIEMLARIKVMLRMCENERLLAQHSSQMKTVSNSKLLRWFEGLLISGDGALSETSRQLLEHLVDRLPGAGDPDPEQLLRLLIAEFPPTWQRTLFKLALIGNVSRALMLKLSEINDIIAMFGYLKRHGLAQSVVSNDQELFSFSPPLAAFLKDRAEQNIGADLRRETLLTAAAWFREQREYGRALDCLTAAEAYDEVSQLFSQTGFLLLNRNFSTLVAPVISRIPERVLIGCGWMSLFRGIYELHGNGHRSDIWLELASHRFIADNNKRGQLLTLAMQVQHTVHFGGAFAAWIEKGPVLTALAEALLPTLSDFERLKVASCQALAEYFFNGDLAQVDKIVSASLVDAQQLQLSEPQIDLFFLHSFLNLQQGRLLTAASSLEQGLLLATQCGSELEKYQLQLLGCELLHVQGDLPGFIKQRELLTNNCSQRILKGSVSYAQLGYLEALLQLACGKLQTASEIVDIALLNGKAVTHNAMHSRLLQLRGWIRALEGNMERAQEDMETALRLRKQLGADVCSLENRLLEAVTRYTLGQYAEAAESLRLAINASKRKGEENLRSGLYALSALISAKLGRKQQAVAELRRFCDLMQSRHCAYFWGMTPAAVEQLLYLAIEQGLNSRLLPLLYAQSASLDEQQRKIPLLKVFCLGRFQIQLGERVFDMSQVGQPSRQIFAALLATPDKTVSIDQLMGQLWPESTPSRARNSFDVAHSRLRRGFEDCFGIEFRDTYLVLEKGMLSLRHVMVDSLEFLTAIESARHHFQRECLWHAELQLWKMDQAWHGGFLAGFDLSDGLHLMRIELDQIRIQQLSMLAQLLNKRRQYERAVQLLQKGLQMEPSCEQLVRQLLQIYRERRNSRAVAQLLKNYRLALQGEDYELDEIGEMVDSLGVKWATLNAQLFPI